MGRKRMMTCNVNINITHQFEVMNRKIALLYTIVHETIHLRLFRKGLDVVVGDTPFQPLIGMQIRSEGTLPCTTTRLRATKGTLPPMDCGVDTAPYGRWKGNCPLRTVEQPTTSIISGCLLKKPWSRCSTF